MLPEAELGSSLERLIRLRGDLLFLGLLVLDGTSSSDVAGLAALALARVFDLLADVARLWVRQKLSSSPSSPIASSKRCGNLTFGVLGLFLGEDDCDEGGALVGEECTEGPPLSSPGYVNEVAKWLGSRDELFGGEGMTS